MFSVVVIEDEALADLDVIVVYDDDPAGEVTATANRIRGLLTQVNQALERVLGPRVQHPAVLELLSQFGGPTGLRAAGKRRLWRWLNREHHAPTSAWWRTS